ncbi:MAG TPA: TonB-dependent receptor, partial [Candidatus Acidoferrum sp.]|nr:TonB-dependent receptor [Candidatus Acidoferrum sp.]
MDPSLAAMAGARVTLVRLDGSTVAETQTDEAGSFNFDRLAPGKYRLSIQAGGFKPYERDINLGSKPLAPLRVVLELAPQTESVRVSSGDVVPRLSTDVSDNQNANTFERDALDRVPVFDQDYITTVSRFLDDNAAGTNGVSLVVDGVEANGPGVSPSGVQEVKINQNPYSARFARPGRARLEIVTKGGTPQFHGTVNFLFRDSIFDAANAFAVTKPSERRQFYEGSLTGPLGHNKKNTFLLTLERDQDDLQSIVSTIGADSLPIHDNVPAPQRHLFSSFRAFHDFANGDQVWASYFFESETSENQGVGGVVLREAGYTQIGREHEINISYRHIFSPKLVNQLRFLIGHNDNPITSNNAAPQVIVEGLFTSGGAQANFNRTESHFDGTDFLTYTSSKHVLTAGVDVPDLSRRGFDNHTNQQGTYTFGSLADYNAGHPSTFLIQQGPGHVVFWERTVAGFFEDDVRLRPNLSVSLGVRYYFQNYFHNDPNNFAPRLSLAYAPSKKSKTVFRGGAGMFFDRTGPRPIADLLLFNGINVQRFLLSGTAANPLTFPVTSADLTGVPISNVTLNPAAHIPYTVQYSAGVERQVTAKSTASITYIGSRGVDLFRSRDVNAPLPPGYLSRPDPAEGQERQVESRGYQKSNGVEFTFR